MYIRGRGPVSSSGSKMSTGRSRRSWCRRGCEARPKHGPTRWPLSWSGMAGSTRWRRTPRHGAGGSVGINTWLSWRPFRDTGSSRKRNGRGCSPRSAGSLMRNTRAPSISPIGPPYAWRVRLHEHRCVIGVGPNQAVAADGAGRTAFRGVLSTQPAAPLNLIVRRRRLQMGPDERAIREVHSTWINAVNAGDLVCLLSLMADDVVFLNPGQAPFDRDAFSANFSAAHQRLRIRCLSELEEVVVVGEVAYTRSRDALS